MPNNEDRQQATALQRGFNIYRSLCQKKSFFLKVGVRHI